MTKLSIDCKDLLEVVDDGKDTSDKSDTVNKDAVDEADMSEDMEEEEDPRKASQRISFKSGHLKLCWRHLMLLPTTIRRPKFCVQARMTDSFIDINEEALEALL